MQHESTTPVIKPIEKSWLDKQRREVLQSYREREEKRLLARRAKRLLLRMRYADNVDVVIEYVGPDRESITRPIVWCVNEIRYGFWNVARPDRGLGPWQERVPASVGLPKVDSSPAIWKLIHDPRDVAEPTAAPEAVDEADEIENAKLDTSALQIELEQLEREILNRKGNYKPGTTPEVITRHKSLRETLGLV